MKKVLNILLVLIACLSFTACKSNFVEYDLAKMSIQIEETDLTIQCKAVQNSMVLEVEVCMCRTAPEKYIRNIRSIEKLKNQIGDSE